MATPKLTSKYYLSKIMNSKTVEEFQKNTSDFSEFKKRRINLAYDTMTDAIETQDVDKMIEAYFLPLY